MACVGVPYVWTGDPPEGDVTMTLRQDLELALTQFAAQRDLPRAVVTQLAVDTLRAQLREARAAPAVTTTYSTRLQAMWLRVVRGRFVQWLFTLDEALVAADCGAIPHNTIWERTDTEYGLVAWLYGRAEEAPVSVVTCTLIEERVRTARKAATGVAIGIATTWPDDDDVVGPSIFVAKGAPDVFSIEQLPQQLAQVECQIPAFITAVVARLQKRSA